MLQQNSIKQTQNVNVKSFSSLKKDKPVVILVSLALSQTPVYTVSKTTDT